jgi:exonuclease SbcC
MRLHRLTFEAIGPYQGVVDIDFAALNDAGRFLLEGPTGAGKSTIIDAIVYALYGGTSGGQTRGAGLDRLDSDYRAPGQQPYVELVFSVGAGTYRVRRSPEHERLRKHGSGTTVERAKVTLAKLAHADDPVGAPMSSRADEAAAEIVAAVGLTREQFVKTIVLPQGQFARFLQAPGGERKAILERIFRTEVFQQLQDRMAELRRSARQERDAAQAAAARALAAFRGAVGATEPGEPGEPTDVDPLAEVAAGLAGLAAAADLEQERVAEAGRLAASAQSEFDAASDLARRLDAVRTAQAGAERLSAEDGATDLLRQRLAAAARAARAADAVAADDQARQAEQQARSAMALAKHAAQGSWADLPAPELGMRRDQLAASAGAFEHWVQVEAGLPARRERVRQLEQDVQGARERSAAAEASLAEVPQRRAGLARACQELAADAAALPAAEQRLAQLADALAAAAGLPAAQAVLAEAQRGVREALQTCSRAEEAAAQRFARYLAGIAAEVGAALTPGEPCSACGSREHPRPAVPAADHVTSEQVERARRRAEEGRARLQDARSACADAAAVLQELEVRLGGERPASIEEAAQEGRRLVEAARAAGEQLDLRRAELAELDELEQQLHAQRGAALESAATLAESRNQAESAVDADERELAERRGSFGSVADRVAAQRQEQAALQRLIDAHELLATSELRAGQTGAGLAAALHREGFATAAAARAALLPAAEQARLQQDVADHEAQWAQVRAVLARPELQGLDPATEVALDDLQQARDAAVQARDGALGRLAAVQDRMGKAQACGAQVRAAVAAVDAVAARTAPAIRLAGVLEGSTNRLKMPLATYVLLQQFDTVVAAANEHLQRMSGDAYSLRATEDKVGRSQRRGLELVVLDHRTGRERSAETLSGGETFYTSLALALGLAEAVQAQAGGLRLETLFVDEGFGSLDPQTLDEVLGVLDGLRHDGRVLGIISHVEDMKLKVHERIEVRRSSPAGPSVVKVVA